MNATFTFYKRQNRKKKNVYYVMFRDPDTGQRLAGISTGKTTKAEATSWAINKLENGKYRPRKELKFKDFTKDMFIWEKCTYIRYLHTKQQRFSRSYADSQRHTLEKHLLPYFSDFKLSNIQVDTIEKFLQKLSNKKYKSTTIANYYNTLSTIMKEAYRLDIIPSNPMEKVRRINKKSKEKGIFRMEEVKKLFGKNSLDEIWNGQLQQMVFNLIAVTTGMRQGEIIKNL